VIRRLSGFPEKTLANSMCPDGGGGSGGAQVSTLDTVRRRTSTHIDEGDPPASISASIIRRSFEIGAKEKGPALPPGPQPWSGS
jgi:hypothetical protein